MARQLPQLEDPSNGITLPARCIPRLCQHKRSGVYRSASPAAWPALRPACGDWHPRSQGHEMSLCYAGDDLDELDRRSLGNLEPTSLTAFGFQKKVVLGAGERRDSSEDNGQLLGVLVRFVPFNVETVSLHPCLDTKGREHRRCRNAFFQCPQDVLFFSFRQTACLRARPPRRPSLSTSHVLFLCTCASLSRHGFR